ncbi:sialic acid-binding Ig-like lectin 14 [Cyprinodon tularosa]|uniref:sialic acid-binding Ig-like lectin 14 n=1 Tax=Cyprinodon tularosa TaxID=77115 RepID=UPI0018E1EB4F|nr:sialic acid-binding Ig-like lectin 14 [Cyprinodon tularosa]
MAAIRLLLTFPFLSGFSDSCPKKPDLFITTPGHLLALSGSCLHIPCNFSSKTRENFTGVNYGVWFIKDPRFQFFPNNLIFNSSGAVKVYPLEITGNLMEKNCTTLFENLTMQHSDKYFFRIENSMYKATASCSPCQVTVTDSPLSPSINISVGDLKEHQSATISCSAVTPCPHSPPELTWNLQQDSERQTEKNPDGTFTTKIQETITLSDTHDGYNISCSARYPVNGGSKTAETEVTLSVSYAPKDTSASISPSGLVSAGSWVELSCSSRAKPPASFTWFRNSKHGAINVSVGQVYSFNVTEGGEYYCEATNDLGNEKSSRICVGCKGMEATTLWPSVAGGFVGIIIVICVVYILWRLKWKTSSLHQTQKPGFQEPAGSVENQDIHYGDIDFSVMRKSFKTVQDEKELQSIVYSEVNVCRPENRLKEAEDCTYAQVKKKPVNSHSS